MKNSKDRKENKINPALKYDWLTPLFDPLLRWFLRENTFKKRLITQARLKGRHRILDLGCGTGTLTLLIKREYPKARVTGLDGDAKVLKIAERKVTKAGVGIKLDRGMSFDLPYPDRSFDKVLSTLFFHHLTHENKLKTLKEIIRVLRPGGELHVADWGKPQNVLMGALFSLVRILDGFEPTEDNVTGQLPELFKESRFESVRERDRYATPLGTVSLYQAMKPKRD